MTAGFSYAQGKTGGHRPPLQARVFVLWDNSVREVPRMKEVVIISAVRTPIGKFQGSLKSFPATQLGAMVVKAAVERAGLEPSQIDEVIMGNVVSAGLGQNPARQAALRGGMLPDV